MKTLYIVRHAKSSWDNANLEDAERPLNERGLRDAPRMAKRLKEKHVVLDLMISSPAKRTLSTAMLMADVLQHSFSKITTNKALYHASANAILTVLKGVSDQHRCIMLFGHNPGLTEFVNDFAGQCIMNIPTCGLVSCTVPVQHWSDLDWGLGQLRFYDYPKRRE